MDISYDIVLHRLGRLMGQTYRLWRRVADLRLQPYGLTQATWRPLLEIARAEAPMSQKSLAASLWLDNSSVVRLVDNLEAAGLVVRQEGEDRRVKIITLTEAGEETVSKVVQVVAELRDEALAEFDQRDIETTYRVLTQLSAFFSERVGDSRP